ncbi:hypothetical protein AMS68_001957 [Peltaster fructicola]|uniref:Uncharacterized protein n=1 Tax=Peltaster fructicola TaxID=286661 RepID=A0A6H0XPN2_9PEZI|nr:hypothetical protein AMS68_001957 [Peltaster fructicola]
MENSHSRNNSAESEKTGSPHRLLSNSYPPTRQPQRAPRKEHGTSVDLKITDLMDEDEARWMSTMESSRAATPIQPSPEQPATKTNERPISPISPVQAEALGHSRNETAPLPKLNDRQHISIEPSHKKAQPSASSTGLTALPQRFKTSNPPTFARRVFLAAKHDLLYNYSEQIRLPWRCNTLTHGAVDLTTLQRMQKHVVQQRLIAQVRALGERECWLEIGIGDTMREYCQILRDLEYMEEHALRGRHHDPFLITTQRPLEAQLLEETGLARQSPGARSARHTIAGPITHIHRASPCWRMLQRLTIICAVAMAVVLPFLVAILTSGYLPRIIVVCACIAVFSVAVTLLDTKGERLLHSVSLTLVYAAALIIFLGTTPQHYSK